MSSATAVTLSLNDNKVLSALFDPEASLDRDSAAQLEPTLSPTSAAPIHIIQAEREAIHLLNEPSPPQQDVEFAIAQLTSIITSCPSYASAYINRAQSCRLLSSSGTNSNIIRDILTDLNKAISLSTPLSSITPVSVYDSRVLASAHTHRGYIFMRASTNSEYRSLLGCLNLPQLGSISSAAGFEELAGKDFSIAGRYGNKTARDLAVKTNPYAKLCGQIVREALQREIKDYYESVAGCASSSMPVEGLVQT